MSPSRESVLRFTQRAPGLRILVAGDVMLDAYISGEATRISPEAPVPVVAVTSRRSLAGGAANVAANIRSLGATAYLAGVTGADSAARALHRELRSAGIDASALIEDPSRATTTKTRVTAAGQQIVRFDDESTAPLGPTADVLLREACLKLIAESHACVISDYAKGVASESFCRWFIETALREGKPVVVDPKNRDLGRYRGAAVITPNMKETAAAAGDPVHDESQLAHAAAHLAPAISPSALLVTRGGEGMSLFEQDSEVFRIPALRVEVSDVTGAGDTVAAVLALALAMQMNLREAATLANLAAGVSVRHSGAWAVHREELLAASERIPEP